MSVLYHALTRCWVSYHVDHAIQRQARKLLSSLSFKRQNLLCRRLPIKSICTSSASLSFDKPRSIGSDSCLDTRWFAIRVSRECANCAHCVHYKGELSTKRLLIGCLTVKANRWPVLLFQSLSFSRSQSFALLKFAFFYDRRVETPMVDAIAGYEQDSS